MHIAVLLGFKRPLPSKNRRKIKSWVIFGNYFRFYVYISLFLREKTIIYYFFFVFSKWNTFG